MPSPTRRSAAAGLVRKDVDQSKAFFAAPPEKVIGIVLHLCGELFAPRFAAEAGRHELETKHARSTCLVEAAEPPLKQYTPPPGIERQGGIGVRGAEWCRRYDRAAKQVEDMELGLRSWTSDDLARCVAEFSRERLDREIEEATQ